MDLRTIASLVGLGFLCGSLGCGDCVDIGYPAVNLTVVDALTGVPVGIGGAVLIVTSSRPYLRRDSVDTSFQGGENHHSVCCVSGSVQIHLQQLPYVAWDTTVVVTTSGHCEIPDQVAVVARLRRG